MLYVTTRNNRDAYTAQRVLRENRGPDGGLYVPFREPVFSREEIDALKEKSFHQCVAEVLNRLFNTKLTRWDVEFCVGRYPVRLVNLPQRIIAGECWHNPEWTFDHLVHILAEQLRGGCPGADGGWAKTAVGIAVLFGIFGEFARAGITEHEKHVDISVVCGNFDLPMSAWYARAWGLPIGNIICCCNENGNLWNLIHHGQFRTDTVSVPTGTPEADVTLPAGLERLIYACGGLAEVDIYLDVLPERQRAFPAGGGAGRQRRQQPPDDLHHFRYPRFCRVSAVALCRPCLRGTAGFPGQNRGELPCIGAGGEKPHL